MSPESLTSRGARIGAALLLALALTPIPAAAQIEAQFFMGSSVRAPLPMTISQTGQPDLHFTGHWATNPLRPTWYYAWRVGIWKGNKGWRLDHTHHKMYLTNPPADVQEFRITNGFNIVTLSRAFRSNHLTYSIGAGPVVAYAYSTVRHLEYQHDQGWSGYTLSGGSIMGTATREFPLVGNFVLSLDGRLSTSYVRVPVVSGNASVPNVAFHFHAGIGYAWRDRKK